MKTFAYTVMMVGISVISGWYADRLYVAHMMRQISDDPAKVNQFTICMGQLYRGAYPYAPGDSDTGANPNAKTK